MEHIRRITEPEELNQALSAPRALLFKHSTRCPISARAMQEVQTFAAVSSVPVYLVSVIENRPLSELVADRLGVRHESPQIIYLEGGNVVWTASHFDITADALKVVAGNRSVEEDT
ncbi:MAG TPA: bacillithiol system redox-active protein YtxJ [Acidobacteriota bacterium]|nr:bacillithiol system redox-active protein YtxJ [Acidobacteriota bacterium]